MRLSFALFLGSIALAAAQLTPEQQARLDELLGSAGDGAEIADLLEEDTRSDAEIARDQAAATKAALDEAAVTPPNMVATDGGVHTYVRPGQEVSFDRLGKESISLKQIEAALDDLQKKFDNSIGTSQLAATIAKAMATAMDKDGTLAASLAKYKKMKQTLSGDSTAAAQADVTAVNGFTTDYTNSLNTVAKLLSDESKARAASNDALDKRLTEFEKVVNEKLKIIDGLPKAIDTSVKSAMKPVTDGVAILSRIKLTYMGNPKVPVFRWNWWHTHQHGSTSWFDGNNDRGFGGVHPSHWTDGNRRANQMNSDVKYLKRFFPRKGTAVNFGATICSDTFIMHSSTTGRMCGVLFRIKNTATSGINWSPTWYFTSWHGWSETASVSINGANNFDRNCGHSYCRDQISMTVPANGDGTRVSTVIFISSGTGAYGVSYGNHERANINMFNDLTLPNGLEYVDDLDTMTGSWKK